MWPPLQNRRFAAPPLASLRFAPVPPLNVPRVAVVLGVEATTGHPSCHPERSEGSTVPIVPKLEADNLVGGEGDGGLAADFVHDAGDGQGIGQGVVAGLKGAVFDYVDKLLELAEVLVRIARNGDVFLSWAA